MYRALNCCRSSDERYKRFKGAFLRTESADAPELINWENLRVNPVQKVCRAGITIALSFLLLLITCAIIVIAKGYELKLREYSPEIDCNAFNKGAITQQQAINDQKK